MSNNTTITDIMVIMDDLKSQGYNPNQLILKFENIKSNLMMLVEGSKDFSELCHSIKFYHPLLESIVISDGCRND
jgi:hypothetical protein